MALLEIHSIPHELVILFFIQMLYESLYLKYLALRECSQDYKSKNYNSLNEMITEIQQI